MKAFAQLLENLLYQPARNGKLALLSEYLSLTPDPDRGYALAALCGDLTLDEVKPALLRGLIEERADAQLFRLSYDFVGDLSETIALMWEPSGEAAHPPGLAQVVDSMRAMSKAEARRRLPDWLDALDATGRWALLKLVTGALRVGVSTGLAKQALAQWSGVAQQEIEEVWHGFSPPYLPLFAWLSGEAARPSANDALCFHSPMLAHPIEDEDFSKLDPSDFGAEWKWDGIRVQIKGRKGAGARLFSRSGDDISAAFPDLIDPPPLMGGLDGELVALSPENNGLEAVASFSTLQQRLNRKTVSAAMLARIPVAIVAYDLLFAADASGENWTTPPLALSGAPRPAGGRGRKSQRSAPAALAPARFRGLGRTSRPSAKNPRRKPSIEGVMLKRKGSPYIAGRPKGEWFKWKRDAHLLDAC